MSIEHDIGTEVNNQRQQNDFPPPQPPNRFDNEVEDVELKKLDLSNTPTISDEVFNDLPDLLKNLLQPFRADKNERVKDIILLSSITNPIGLHV